MSEGLDKDFTKHMNFMNARKTKVEYIQEQTKLLKQKQALLKDLQDEAKDFVARGVMPMEDTIKKIAKLKNEIIPNIQKSINLERERM